MGKNLEDENVAIINNASSEKPFFSVIIPTKNRDAELKTCLETIAEQTFKNFEVIIVDQSDCTFPLLSYFKEELRFLTYVYNPRIDGLVAARNVGLGESRGLWICYIDDDVLLPENFLDLAENFIKNHPDVSGFSPEMVDKREKKKNSIVSKITTFLFYRGIFSDDRRTFYAKRKKFMFARDLHGCVFYKADVFSAPFFNEMNDFKGYSLGEDKFLSRMVSKRFKLALTREFYFIHNKVKKGKPNHYSFCRQRSHFYISLYRYEVKFSRGIKRYFNPLLLAWFMFGLLIDSMIYHGGLHGLKGWYDGVKN